MKYKDEVMMKKQGGMTFAQQVGYTVNKENQLHMKQGN